MVNFADRLNARVCGVLDASDYHLIHVSFRLLTPSLGGGSDWRALVIPRNERAPGSQCVHFLDIQTQHCV
jgi:hypothetical protein